METQHIVMDANGRRSVQVGDTTTVEQWDGRRWVSRILVWTGTEYVPASAAVAHDIEWRLRYSDTETPEVAAFLGHSR